MSPKRLHRRHQQYDAEQKLERFRWRMGYGPAAESGADDGVTCMETSMQAILMACCEQMMTMMNAGVPMMCCRVTGRQKDAKAA